MNIDQLLESERGRGGFSPEQRAAMWKGIQGSLGAAAAGAVAAKAAAATSVAASASAPVARSATTIAKWKLGALLSAVAIGGAGAGAAAHARWGEPKIVVIEQAPAPVAQVAPPPTETQAAPSTNPPAPEAPQPEPTVRTNVTPGKTVAPSAPSSTLGGSPKDPSLARERTLLDMSRTALSRGDASGALASLDTHAREFPSSQLAEEREVLAIQALASAGRLPEARRRAAAFRTRFVNSPLLPIVDEATQ